MKQTAVQQIYLEMFAIVIGDIYLNDRTMFKVQNLIEKYREMEKEQIETAFEEGMFHHTNGLCPDEYYNETYKSE